MTMAFTFTPYIYPMQESVVLSTTLGYSLDNPRTPEEIHFVLNYIRPAIVWSTGQATDSLRKRAWELTLARIEQENRGHNEYLLGTLKGEPDEVLAKNWVILRYDDQGEFDGIRKNLDRLIQLGWEDNAEGFLNNYHQLEAYGHLLQLFVVEPKEYYGQPLTLLHSPFNLFESNDTEHMRHIAFTISHFERNIVDEPSNFGYGWGYFPRAKGKLLQASQLLEQILLSEEQNHKTSTKETKTKRKDFPKQRILYVGDLLRIIYSQSYDLKVKFLLLVSILELLVTHSPEPTKNVEDSIRKQFILKLTLLLHKNDPGMDLASQKKKLSNIYDIRSAIAHGGEVEASIQELRQLIKDLYGYVQVVFTIYITDIPFVDFLKAN